MALAGPPRNHEIGAAAKAIFTPVRGRGILRSSHAASPGGFRVGATAALLRSGARFLPSARTRAGTLPATKSVPQLVPAGVPVLVRPRSIHPPGAPRE